MAYTTIDDSAAFFAPALYTGNDTARTITTGLDTAWNWIKVRTAAGTINHNLTDTVTGATNWLNTNLDGPIQTNADTVTGFTSTGFTLGDDNGGYGFNDNTEDYICWNWRLGTTSGITGGDITPSGYSINTTSGMGIYDYAGTGADETIAHGLGAAPQFWFVKCRSATADWSAAHQWLNKGVTPFEYKIAVNLDSSDGADTTWADTAPTSTVLSLGNVSTTNNSGKTYKLYAFTPIKGFSSFTYFDGNGNADGPFVHTGFQPAFVMMKNTESTGEWCMYTWGGEEFIAAGVSTDDSFYANYATTQITGISIDMCSTGFKIKTSNGDRNASGNNFLVVAFARTPFVNSNGVPSNAVASTA